MRLKGKITSWNDEKGFGFITPNAGGKTLFVHIKAFNSAQRPQVDQTVTYSVTKDKSGRPCAENVSRAGDSKSKDNRKNKVNSAVFISLIFLMIVIISVVTDKVPFLLIPYFLVLSLVTFVWYRRDKFAAQNNYWRTPESTLHFLSLIGGWPGAMIAQQTLRHKSKKVSFRIIFWLTVLMNCIAYGWIHTQDGFIILNRVIQVSESTLHLVIFNLIRITL